MKTTLKFFIPLLLISIIFFVPAFLTDNNILKLMLIFSIVFATFIYAKGVHQTPFIPNSRYQKAIFALVITLLVVFSFFVCTISIEDEWLFEYPLKGSVDDYGCYHQMFDAFQKGQLNIDTDYDLSVIDSLENPYDTAARRQATGEKFSVIWDRAYFDGKLYSYFGIAPVIFLYYPVYFITGAVLSDALAAAIIVAISCIFIMLVLWELCARIKGEVPFILLILGGITATFGSLLWSTETCANFYHIAVLSGICSVLAFFYFVLRAEKCQDQFKRKLFFIICGITVAAIVASRPNMALYIFIALPLLINIIIKRPYGTKSLIGDIIAFCVPMFILGGLIMAYNYGRFGNVFDFGTNYQLTLADTSTYSLSGALIIPSLYHFFFNPPAIDNIFPYIHPAIRRLPFYNVNRVLYVSNSVGALWFPAVWGSLLLPVIRKKRLAFITAATAVLSVLFISFFDMCYGGVHLRYSADIMFILILLGIYLLIYSVSIIKKNRFIYVSLYTAVVVLFALTILIEIPLCFDNERDMILKFHRAFYDFIAM